MVLWRRRAGVPSTLSKCWIPGYWGPEHLSGCTSTLRLRCLWSCSSAVNPENSVHPVTLAYYQAATCSSFPRSEVERVRWGLVSEVRAGLLLLESWYQAWKWEVFLLCVLGDKSKKRIFTKERQSYFFWGKSFLDICKNEYEPLHLI